MTDAVRSRAPLAGEAAGQAVPRVTAFSWAVQRAREPYVQLLVAQISVTAGASVANILMARALAPSGRGWIALLLQVSYLGSQVLLLGTERSFIASYSGCSPAVAVRAYTRLAIRPCVAGLALVALADPIVPTHLRPSWTVVAMVAGFTVVNVFVLAMRAIAIAINQVMVYFRYTALGQVILLAAMGGLYAGGVTSVSMWFLTYVLSGIVPTAVCWIRWWRTRDHSGAPVDAGQSRAVRREGLALIPASIANMGMLRVDRLILPALASTTELGLYATVATMTQLISWPLQAYADARLGAWRAAHRGGWLRSSPLVLSAAIYCLVVAPVLGVITYLLVVPLFGDPYAAAKVLVPPLIAAAAVYALSRITLGLLIAQRRNLLASTAEVCGFAVSMIGFVLLIPSQGAMGAAYGSLLGYGACLIVAAVAVRLGRTGAGKPEPPG